jgi:hypothetical protein
MKKSLAFPKATDELTRTFFDCWQRLLLPGVSRHMMSYYLKLMAYCSAKLTADRERN